MEIGDFGVRYDSRALGMPNDMISSFDIRCDITTITEFFQVSFLNLSTSETIFISSRVFSYDTFSKISAQPRYDGHNPTIFDQGLKARRALLGDACIDKILQNGVGEFSWPGQQIVSNRSFG